RSASACRSRTGRPALLAGACRLTDGWHRAQSLDQSLEVVRDPELLRQLLDLIWIRRVLVATALRHLDWQVAHRRYDLESSCEILRVGITEYARVEHRTHRAVPRHQLGGLPVAHARDPREPVRRIA